jgi:hypothetical protein
MNWTISFPEGRKLFGVVRTDALFPFGHDMSELAIGPGQLVAKLPHLGVVDTWMPGYSMTIASIRALTRRILIEVAAYDACRCR